MGSSLGSGVCNSDLCGIHGIAKLPPAVRTATGVAGDGVCFLTSCKIGSYCDDLLSLDGKVNGIRDGECSVGNADRVFAREGDLLQCLCLDLMNAGCLIRGQSNCQGRDGQVGTSEYVRDLNADLRSLCCHVQSLPDR